MSSTSLFASTSLFIHDDEGDLHNPVDEEEVKKMKHINCNMRSIRLAIVLAIVYQGLIFWKCSSLVPSFRDATIHAVHHPAVNNIDAWPEMTDIINILITCRAKLLKCDWLMRRAFFLNSGQKLLDPDWLRRFILSIRTKYQKYTQ